MTIKVGLQGNPPNISVDRGTLDQKRQVEFYVNDIKSTLGRLNAQLSKCKRVNVDVTLKIEHGEDGAERVVIESAVLP